MIVHVFGRYNIIRCTNVSMLSMRDTQRPPKYRALTKMTKSPLPLRVDCIYYKTGRQIYLALVPHRFTNTITKGCMVDYKAVLQKCYPNNTHSVKRRRNRKTP